MKCIKCNNEINENDKFCSECGTKINSNADNKETGTTIDEIVDKASKTVEKVLDTEDNTKKYTKKDIEDNKAMAIISYFGPLAMLPYFGQKNSKFAQFHAVNGMNLFVIEIALYILYSVIEKICYVFKFNHASNLNDILSRLYGNTIPWFLSLPLGILNFIVVSLSLIGIVYAACGKAKELPLIGKFKIIKK